MSNALKAFLRRSVLCTSEVAGRLGLTRQGVHNLIKQGQLEPMKRSKAGMIFLYEDVEKLQRVRAKSGLFCLPVTHYGNSRETILTIVSGRARVLISGRVASGKTTLLNYLKECLKDRIPPVLFFDSEDHVNNSFLKTIDGAAAVVQAENESEALSSFAEKIGCPEADLAEKVDYVVMLEHGEFVILQPKEFFNKNSN